MTEQERHSARTDPDGPPPTPGWVKVLGLAVALLVLLIVLGAVTGLAGGHGPRVHGG